MSKGWRTTQYALLKPLEGGKKIRMVEMLEIGHLSVCTPHLVKPVLKLLSRTLYLLT
jgi:hypothetical protein